MIYHESINLANTTTKWSPPLDSEEAFSRHLKGEYNKLEAAGWIDQEIEYTFNSQGFRDEEFPRDLNYLAVGCSHTMGVGLRYEQTWVSQLSKLIDKKIYNAGVAGAATDTVYRIVSHLLSGYQPDIVFMLRPPAWRWELSEDNKTFKVYNYNTYHDYRSTHLDYYFLNDINSGINAQKNMDAINYICNRSDCRLIELSADYDLIADEGARDLMHSGPNAHKDIANKFKELL
jgi:hypothetical protein